MVGDVSRPWQQLRGVEYFHAIRFCRSDAIDMVLFEPRCDQNRNAQLSQPGG